jgi:hypothetical protein
VNNLIKATIAALALFPAAAGAADTQPPTATKLSGSGNWSSWYLPARPGVAFEACSLRTVAADQSRFLSLSVNAGDQSLRINIAKDSWHLPEGAIMSASLAIDGKQWTMPNGSTANRTTEHGMAIYLVPARARAFLSDIAAGTEVKIMFTGNEPMWTVPLNGTTAALEGFLRCARHVTPTFFASLAPPTSPAAPPQATSPAAPTSPAEAPRVTTSPELPATPPAPPTRPATAPVSGASEWNV